MDRFCGLCSITQNRETFSEFNNEAVNEEQVGGSTS